MSPEKKDYCRALGEVQPHIGVLPSSLLLPAPLNGASENSSGRSQADRCGLWTRHKLEKLNMFGQ